jgi:hypothetical protein
MSAQVPDCSTRAYGTGLEEGRPRACKQPKEKTMSANEMADLNTKLDAISTELGSLMDKMVGASQVSLDQRAQWAQRLYRQIVALRNLTLHGEHMAA